MKKNNFGRPAGWPILRPNLPGGSLGKIHRLLLVAGIVAGQIALVNSLPATKLDVDQCAHPILDRRRFFRRRHATGGGGR